MKINKDEVLKIKQGKMYLGGDEMNDKQFNALYNEIQIFKKLSLRKIFFETLKQYAMEEGFEGAVKWDDVVHFRGMVDGIKRMEKIEQLIESHGKPESNIVK